MVDAHRQVWVNDQWVTLEETARKICRHRGCYALAQPGMGGLCQRHGAEERDKKRLPKGHHDEIEVVWDKGLPTPTLQGNGPVEEDDGPAGLPVYRWRLRRSWCAEARRYVIRQWAEVR
jgi:hypothetical protein